MGFKRGWDSSDPQMIQEPWREWSREVAAGVNGSKNHRCEQRMQLASCGSAVTVCFRGDFSARGDSIPKTKGQSNSPTPLTTERTLVKSSRKTQSSFWGWDWRSRFYIWLACMCQKNGNMWWATGIILKIMSNLKWRAMSLHAPVPVVAHGWVGAQSHTCEYAINGRRAAPCRLWQL